MSGIFAFRNLLNFIICNKLIIRCKRRIHAITMNKYEKKGLIIKCLYTRKLSKFNCFF